MKEIEKYVWAISIVTALSIIIVQISYLDIGGDSKYVDIRANFYLEMIWRLAAIYLAQLVAAIWLFFAAKTESLSQLAWALFGAVFGVLGVVCFYAASTHFQLKSIRQKRTESATKT